MGYSGHFKLLNIIFCVDNAPSVERQLYNEEEEEERRLQNYDNHSFEELYMCTHEEYFIHGEFYFYS